MCASWSDYSWCILKGWLLQWGCPLETYNNKVEKVDLEKRLYLPKFELTDKSVCFLLRSFIVRICRSVEKFLFCYT